MPIAVDFTATPHALIVGEAHCGKTAALRTICRELLRTNDSRSAQLVLVDLRRTLLGVVETDHLRGYAMSVGDAEGQLGTLAAELRARLPHGTLTQRQLRDRSWWSGPDVYVVVDDYELVSGASVNPLSALVDLVPYAKDVGLHLIVTRRAGGAGRAMYEPVLQRLRELGTPGLVMAGDRDEGALVVREFDLIRERLHVIVAHLPVARQVDLEDGVIIGRGDEKRCCRTGRVQLGTRPTAASADGAYHHL